MTRTLVLGAGFGGISAATALAGADGHEVVLADRSDGFAMGLRKVWDLLGIGALGEGTRSRAGLAGVRFVQGEIESLDPEARAAVVAGEAVEADFLVVALGAESRPDLVPGLAEHGHDVWTAARVPAAREALERFSGGRIAVVVAGTPYTCPPAPYELAMLLDEWLRDHGQRARTELAVSTVQPMLLPNAGREGSEWIAAQLSAREIAFEAGRAVERVEEGRVVYAEGELEFDLLFGVPPHRAPRIVAESPLAGEGGWVHVDPRALATPVPRVYAIGDVTSITLANGLPLPKAGIVAELEGRRVAAAIAAEAAGREAPAGFDGHGFCFVELGRSLAAMVQGEFYAEPEPRVRIDEPSGEHAEAKRRFEAERLERWFG